MILGGNSLPAKKPDPLPMLTPCEQLDVEPRETVAVGDSENDALAGRTAGIATLTVPYGYNHRTGAIGEIRWYSSLAAHRSIGDYGHFGAAGHHPD